MAHIFDLDSTQKQELLSPGLSAIGPKVLMRSKMKGALSSNPDGSVNFGPNYQVLEVDLSCGILNNDIVIKSDIPALPTQNGRANNQGNVRIQIDNTQKYLSAVQEEAIMDYQTIEDAEITITATAGSMNELPMFKGRVVRTPVEEEGQTTFDVRSSLWDIIDVELVLEKALSGGTINPVYYASFSGGVVNTPTISNGIEFYHGISCWDEYGGMTTSVNNDGADKIQIYRIDFQALTDGTNPQLGLYEIKFISSVEFLLTQPDNQRFLGSINADFSGGFVNIPMTAWNVTGDPTGTTIEFNCYYTVKGNPISIVKNILYKAFTGEWGKAYIEDPTLLIDWDKFNCIENYYQGTDVYISETNEDNDVFSPQKTDKPFRIKDFAQKILDHVNCQLKFDSQGRISINSSLYLCDGESSVIYESCHLSTGETRASGHRIFGEGQKYDFMRIKYGLNPVSGNYGGTQIFFDQIKSKYQNIFEVSYDYFKKGIHDALFFSACHSWELLKYADIRLELNFLPNWGLAIEPGDKFEVNFTVQPVLPNSSGLGRYWEAYSVSKRVGGIVNVKARIINSITNPKSICEMIICEDRIN